MGQKKKLKNSVFILGVMLVLLFCVSDAWAADKQDTDMTTEALSIDGTSTGTYTFDMTELYGSVYIPVNVFQPGESRVDITIANAKENIVVLGLRDREWSLTENWMFGSIVGKECSWSRTFGESSTYYLYLLTSQIGPEEDHVIVTVKHTYTAPTGNAELKSGEWLEAVQAEDDLYYQVKLEEKGCINMETKVGGGKVAMLDRNKKVLLKDWTSGDYFALNPGVYYIRVRNNYKDGHEVGRYRIRYNFLKAASSGPAGGKKMSEAKKLKLGQKVSLFQAYTSTKKESKTYYKVEVQKKKKLYVTYQIYSDHASKFEYTLYQKDKKTGKFISFDFVRPDLFEESGRKITKCLSEDTDVDMKTWKVTKKKAAVPAGTYYIKVKRGNGMCSFTIK